jgi:hypothetical protein
MRCIEKVANLGGGNLQPFYNSFRICNGKSSNYDSRIETTDEILQGVVVVLILGTGLEPNKNQFHIFSYFIRFYRFWKLFHTQINKVNALLTPCRIVIHSDR